MRLVLPRYLHFICIFVDAIKSELLALTFQSHCEDVSSYQTITRLLQSERINKLRFTSLAILSISDTHPVLLLAAICPLTFSQNM